MTSTTDGELREILPASLPAWIQRENHFRAGQDGLDADYIFSADGSYRAIRDVIADLIDLCAPIASEINEVEGLRLAKEILSGHAGYALQVETYRQTDSMRAVTAALAKRLRA